MRDAMSTARRHYNVEFDPKHTWVIGDTVLDIEGGKRNGLKTLGVATGGKYTVDDLIEAGADAALENLAETDTVLRIFDRA
jgi:phosphoglycolate phosphatase-like HAD superfamily hydrolase